MVVSTKGRYALRVMIDLAEHCDNGYVAMREVAERQDISLKYLEKIMPSLVSNKMIEGVHGKGGGYKLTKPASDYNVGDILKATEGDLAPVACLECGAEKCEKQETCKTIGMWSKLNDIIGEYFDGITLEDLKNGKSFDDI